MRRRILAEADRFEPLLRANNLLDRELYDWAARELYPAQVRDYGAGRLERDLARAFGPYALTLGDRARLAQNRAFRVGIYLPFVRAFGAHTHPTLAR